MAIFEGAGVALVTPFKENGEVNYEKLEEIVEEQIAGGTDSIIVCGTTGEASTMSHEEHLDVVGYVCKVTGKRIPVIAGTGSNCTETAVYLSAEAQRRGADGLLLVSPYYNKDRSPTVQVKSDSDTFCLYYKSVIIEFIHFHTLFQRFQIGRASCRERV